MTNTSSAAVERGSSATETPLLNVHGIEKAYGGVRALHSVDFHVNPGEIVGLVGPNGSGKSTLLACMSRDIPADAGQIHFAGADITKLRPSAVNRHGLSRTFQSVRVFPELTVWENALLGRQWRGVGVLSLLRKADDETVARVSTLLELVEISDLAKEYAGNLSGGQLRLLELVMAMASKPRLVLLDEATSGVNPTLIEALKRYVQLLHAEEGVSFLLVEHNIGFIFSIAHRIVVLQDGQVLADGTPTEIRENSEVIDAYLGA